MQKRRLANTDINVSVLGLGTVKFGRNQGVKFPEAFELPDDKALDELLGTAKACGINLLDTAPAYGLSEERLGKLLVGQRHEWVISTKVGEEFVDGQSQFDFSPRAVQLSIERSLKRLRTDYLDIVLVHSNGEDERIIQEDRVFEQLIKCQQQGKVRCFGMSTKTVAGGKTTVDQADAAMVAFNPNYDDERDVIAYAHQKQKGIFIKKAFASGHLNTLGNNPVTDTFQFILAEPGVTSIIVGTINPAHLRYNADCLLALSQ